MTNKLRALEIELEKAKQEYIYAVIDDDYLGKFKLELKLMQLKQNIKKERERLNAD